jgi:hypothetical protein
LHRISDRIGYPAVSGGLAGYPILPDITSDIRPDISCYPAGFFIDLFLCASSLNVTPEMDMDQQNLTQIQVTHGHV